METLPALEALCEGNTPITGGSTKIPVIQDWYFICCQPEQSVERIVYLPVSWVAMMLMLGHYNGSVSWEKDNLSVN